MFIVTQSPSSTEALTNLVYFSTVDYAAFHSANTTLGEAEGPLYAVLASETSKKALVYTPAPHDAIADGSIGLSGVQRRCLGVSAGNTVSMTAVAQEWIADASIISINISFYHKNSRASQPVNSDDIAQHIQDMFSGHMWQVDQEFVFEFCGTRFVALVDTTQVEYGAEMMQRRCQSKRSGVSTASSVGSRFSPRGILTKDTWLQVTSSSVPLMGHHRGAGNIGLDKPLSGFKDVGGMDQQFEELLRRAFMTRGLPMAIQEEFDVEHIKGILLFGPPGTGKTLIARKIGDMLDAKHLKIVNGPEIFDKMVGNSALNIRNLFVNAEEDWENLGAQSPLHVIVLDEIDSICKSRGSSSGDTGVGDQVVNQLLTKIDGMKEMNNVLVIGMTNRKDLLDEALLRPGRLEVQLPIGIPDCRGRAQILEIHVRTMRDNSRLDDDVALEELAEMTDNYTGAELKGLVKSAKTFAFNRAKREEDDSDDDPTVTSLVPKGLADVKVTMADFVAAVKEVKPALGRQEDSFTDVCKNGFIVYNERFTSLMISTTNLVQQVVSSTRNAKASLLIEGSVGCGKSAIAAKVAMESAFPFAKVVNAEKFVGKSEFEKSAILSKTFTDAYKSPSSVIVLDDVEDLLGFVPLGNHFSHSVLHTMKVYMKKTPPPITVNGSTMTPKILIIATTSKRDVLEKMGLLACFSAVMTVPNLRAPDVIEVLEQLDAFQPEDREMVRELVRPEISVPMKKLLSAVEMASQGSDPATHFTAFISAEESSFLVLG